MPRTDEQVFISVDGRPVQIAAAKLLSITVDQSLVLPDAFDINLIGGLDWLKDGTFGFGKEVKIEMASGMLKKTLLVGEVTALDTNLYRDNQVHLSVRGFDRSHRLLRGKHTRTYSQMTDSDIASRIAQEAGLGTSGVMPTFTVHDFILQQNETNLEFLRRRALRIGYEVGVNDNSLYFKEVGEPAEMGVPIPVKLKWGEGLEEISFSHTSAGQATKVIVRGWDHAKKQEVIGEAQSSSVGPQINKDHSGSDVVNSAFGVDSPLVIIDDSVASQAEAEKLAKAALDELQGSFITASGLAGGNTGITPGAKVTIEGAGTYDGSYVVSEAVHKFDRGGYQTSFKVGGSRATPKFPGNSNHGTPAPTAAGQGTRLAVAIVTNNADPQNLGRVKVKYPWLADNLESDWCRVVSPMAGAMRGLFLLPEINDEVLVAGVDWSRPLVLGALWNSSDAPPLTTSQAVVGGKVVQRTLTTRNGNTLLFDDTDGKGSISIYDMSGNHMNIDTASGKITLSAIGDIDISGLNIKLTASANVDIKGARINLN